jgi:hypothetical protein
VAVFCQVRIHCMYYSGAPFDLIIGSIQYICSDENSEMAYQKLL